MALRADDTAGQASSSISHAEVPLEVSRTLLESARYLNKQSTVVNNILNRECWPWSSALHRLPRPQVRWLNVALLTRQPIRMVPRAAM